MKLFENSDALPRMTLTVSCPFELFVWLKKNQHNCSAYVVTAVQEKMEREEQEKKVGAK